MELAYPPFETTDENGDPAGISVEMAYALGEYLDRPVRIENMAWSGLIPALTTGKIDIILSSMTITEERAMAINPNLLLLDEPTSALDPQLTNEVLEMVLELKKSGTNLILVTHEMSFAQRAAEYVLYISRGKAVEHGSPDQIFAHTQSEELREFLYHI